jgi:hypothetical protein
MGVDGFGWGFGISWMGEDGSSDGCWKRQLWPRNCCVYLATSFFAHFLQFENLWMGLGSSWAQIGFSLGSDWAPIFQIEVLGVTFGTSRPDFG